MTRIPDVGFFDLHDDSGVRPAQQFGQHYAGLRIAVIVGLQAGEDEIKFLVFDRSGQGAGSVRSIQTDEGAVFKVNGAVRALGQGLA